MNIEKRLSDLEARAALGGDDVALDVSTLSQATQNAIAEAMVNGKLDATLLGKEAQREILQAADRVRQ